jgi:hypothetical protein
MSKPVHNAARLLRGLAISFITLVCAGAIWYTPATPAGAEIPKRIGDSAFWQMISDFSEGGGSFPYDNFVSNETLYQRVIPEIQQNTKPGGVYLGVGPEQNFTYIAALQPRIAFIIDIRRDNMLEHLVHKALLEVSSNRAEYISRLFSRKRPVDAGSASTVEQLFQAYGRVPPDRKLFEANLKLINDRLVQRHGFKLSDDDEKSVRSIYEAFYAAGPGVTYYGFKPPIPDLLMPSYQELMTETDGRGVNRSYLANEENFRILRELERNNLVVPLVADFAGPKTIRAVGAYLADRHAAVTTIYVSNVEQYLFQQGDNWRKYYLNLAALPLAPSSTFIRSVNRIPPPCPKCVVVTLLCPVANLMRAFTAGAIASYSDVIQMSK